MQAIYKSESLQWKWSWKKYIHGKKCWKRLKRIQLFNFMHLARGFSMINSHWFVFRSIPRNHRIENWTIIKIDHEWTWTLNIIYSLYEIWAFEKKKILFVKNHFIYGIVEFSWINLRTKLKKKFPFKLIQCLFDLIIIIIIVIVVNVMRYENVKFKLKRNFTYFTIDYHWPYSWPFGL